MSSTYLDPKKVYTYFNNNFSLSKSSKGWYLFKCPFCNELKHRKKIAVHTHYRSVKCWICGYKESTTQFVMDYENLTYRKALDFLGAQQRSKVTFEITQQDNYIKADVELPVGFTPLMMGDGNLGTRARAYLSGRGFSIDELDREGFGYCNVSAKEEADNYLGYIIIPFYSYGQLAYFIGRDFIGNFLRYKNPAKATFGIGKADLWFNQDAFYLYQEVFCVEGWSCARTMGERGSAHLGSKWSITQIRIAITSPCRRLVLIPDAGIDGNGEYFYNLALDLAIDLIDHKEVMVINLNVIGPDVDINEIGRAAVMELYDKADLETFESLLTKRIN